MARRVVSVGAEISLPSRRARRAAAAAGAAAAVLRRRAMAPALVLAFVAACTSGEAPRLTVTPLASETRDGAVRAAFELRNDGGRPLILDRVVPACGCGAVSRLPPDLAPRAHTRLDVECRGPRLAGEDVHELTLRTSDPRRPETPLRVELGPAPADPAPIYLGYVTVGATLVRDVPVPGASPARAAASGGGEVAAEPLPPAADGTRLVRLRFMPRTPGVVRTAIDLGPAGMLPVTAVAWDRVLAFPAEVRVPRATGGAGLPAVILVAAGEAPLAIARVDYPPGVAGELRTVVPGRQYRLSLYGRGPMPAGDAAIRVVAAGAADPVLVIPLVDAAAPPPA